MSATQNAVELCTLLVEDAYGQLYARIFNTLLLHGRLEAADIGRRTGLSKRQILSALSVLIQQRLVFNYSSSQRSPTFYEADWKSAYSLARFGKVVKFTNNKYGTEAGEIVSTLLELGHCRVGDLLAKFTAESQDVEKNKGLPNGLNNQERLTNGNHDKSKSEPDLRREAVKVLAEQGFIIRARPANFRSPADNRIEADRWVRNNKSFTERGKKLQLEIDQVIDSTLEEWYDGSILRPQRLANGSSGSRKRRQSETENSRGPKRAKLENGVSEYHDEKIEGIDQVVDVLSDDLVIRVNHEKYLVAFRSASLVSQAETTIGKVTADVYQALLTNVEEKIQRCQPNNDVHLEDREDNYPAVPLFRIRQELGIESGDLAAAIGTVPPILVDTAKFSKPGKSKWKRLAVNDDEAIVVDSASSDEHSEEERNDEMEIVKDSDDSDTDLSATDPLLQHLYLLSTSWPQYRFCETVNSKYWVVPFASLSISLLHTTLLNLINTRFGPESARIVRVLLYSSTNIPTLRLHENQLTALSLLPARTVRAAVARLHAAHFLSLQEVPKDNQRMPQKTTYLWFFDVERVRKVVLMECYKAMARLLQRLKVEREKMKELLEKLDRSDVRESGERLLSFNERENLKKWRAMEDRIWGEMGRLDDMVMVLSDF